MQTRFAQTGMFLIPFQRTPFGSSPERNSKAKSQTLTTFRSINLARFVRFISDIPTGEAAFNVGVEVAVAGEFCSRHCRDTATVSGSETCLSEVKQGPEGHRLRSPSRPRR